VRFAWQGIGADGRGEGTQVVVVEIARGGAGERPKPGLYPQLCNAGGAFRPVGEGQPEPCSRSAAATSPSNEVANSSHRRAPLTHSHVHARDVSWSWFRARPRRPTQASEHPHRIPTSPRLRRWPATRIPRTRRHYPVQDGTSANMAVLALPKPLCRQDRVTLLTAPGRPRP